MEICSKNLAHGWENFYHRTEIQWAERQGVCFDIIYDARAKVPKIQRDLHPPAIVWWELSWNGASAIYFCMPGLKLTTKISEETILKPVVKPLNDTLFKWATLDLLIRISASSQGKILSRMAHNQRSCIYSSVGLDQCDQVFFSLRAPNKCCQITKNRRYWKLFRDLQINISIDAKENCW